VFGRAAAIRAAEVIQKGTSPKELAPGSADRALERLDRLRHAKGNTTVASLRLEMQRTMQNYCPVYRTGEVLAEGVKLLQDVWAKKADLKVEDRSLVWNSDLVEAIELDNLTYQAVATMNGALNRTESRGAQAREDFPNRDDQNWMKHTTSWVSDAGEVTLGGRPVHLYTLTDEVEVVAPKARVY